MQSHITKNIKIKAFEGYEIPLGKNYTLEKIISELNFMILYKCINSTNCDLRDEDKYDYIDYIHMNQSKFNLCDLRLTFNGYYCEHQNPTSPIKREITYENFLFSVGHHVEYYTYDWKIYKYEEDTSVSGMFKQAEIFYGGEFTDIIRYSIPSTRMINETNDNNEIIYYKLLSIIQFNKNNYRYYEFYIRNKISIFDTMANIWSLIITLYGIITFIFCSFYSNSFDNYKIIEKVISNNTNLHMSRDSIINQVGSGVPDFLKNNKEIPLVDIKEEGYDNDKTLKEEFFNIKEENNNDIIKKDKNTNFILKKYYFYDFFCNNVYSKKCCNSPTQKIITACNDIKKKYYSIDSIIFNQLRLENLFKDYKWNNPKLKNIENNDLIAEIKYLSGY